MPRAANLLNVFVLGVVNEPRLQANRLFGDQVAAQLDDIGHRYGSYLFSQKPIASLCGDLLTTAV